MELAEAKAGGADEGVDLLAPALLAVSGLTIRFGGVTALQDVSFEVARGAICGLIGPNGAGKTTLFNCISRLYDPGAGSIFVDQHLPESVGGALETLSDFAPQRLEKRRNRGGLDHGAAVVVVAVAKADHLPVRLIAMKVERLERESGEFARQRLLLISG